VTADLPAEIRVLIADDQAVVRAGLAMLLDSQPGLTVVGQAGNGQEAVLLARELTPDVVLMDIRMPLLDGLAATRRILQSAEVNASERPLRVVILTTYDLDEYVYDALRAGACGFLLKHAPPEELVLGIRAAADGGALISPSVTRRLLEEFTARRPTTRPPAALARLTPANVRSSTWSCAAAPTPRSPGPSRSLRPPSRPISRTSSGSSGSATASTLWSTATSMDSSPQAPPPSRPERVPPPGHPTGPPGRPRGEVNRRAASMSAHNHTYWRSF
jgi:DNA-binding NarL/FixJ family response regulator